MSDQALGPQRDRLDRAIDQAVRRLVSRDAPADLRARVLERLSQPASTWWAWKPQRLALAGATAAIAIVVVLVAPRWLEQTAAPPQESQTAAGVPVRPTVAAPRQPESGSHDVQPSEVTRRTPSRPGSTRTVGAATMTARSDEFLSIDPLPAPNPIRIEPLESERVTLVPLEIAPLPFETVQIESLPVSR